MARNRLFLWGLWLLPSFATGVWAVGRPPFITNQPVSQIVAAGTDVTFRVSVAASTTLLSYQWLKGSVPIAGWTNDTLTLTNVALSRGGSYKVLVANAAGSVTSEQAGLTVVEDASISTSLGGALTLNALVGGPPLTSCQWRFNGVDLPGATNTTFSLTNVGLANVGQYSGLFSNAAGSLTLLLPPLMVDPAFTKITTGPVVNELGDFGSAAWGDYDNDGDLDLFLAHEGGVSPLFRNDGNGVFTKTVAGELGRGTGSSVSGSWADYDNDGQLDLFVGNSGHENDQLYRNRGDGTFALVRTAVVAQDATPTAGGAWADYDNDGCLDLFVSISDVGSEDASRLYRGRGDGTFELVTSPQTFPREAAASFGCAWADYDNDGDLDLFVANGGFYGNQRDFLYRNTGNGAFAKITSGPLVDSSAASTACAWGDYDNDGDLDPFVAVFLGPSLLYRNEGNGAFTQVASDRLLAETGRALSAGWADYDNDGDLDLYVWRGSQGSLLYRNNGDGTFERVRTGSLAAEYATYGFGGMAWGDYDNDGFLDLVVTREVTGMGTDQCSLFRNNGNSNAWLRVRCIGVASNRNGIGAKVRAQALIAGQPRWQMREITGGDGNGNSVPLEAHFGLGDATLINTLRIEWPSGLVQELRDVAPRQILTVTEPNLTVTPPRVEYVHEARITLTAKTSIPTPLWQWQFLGADLPGETNATLIVPELRPVQAGAYSVVVRTPGSTDTASASAVILPPVPPTVTQQPQSQTVDPGSTASFVASATGTAPLAYQWLRNGEPVAGATNATLVVPNVQLPNVGEYAVLVANPGGSITSAGAWLAIVGAAAIGTQPKDQSASLGANVTLGVVPSGTLPFAYQWRFNGVALEAATQKKLNLANVTLANAGGYDVVVANAFGAVTSRVAVLDVDSTFTKVTQADLVTWKADHQSAALADYDNDGWIDILILAGSDGGGDRTRLYHNNADGTGTFSRVTEGPIANSNDRAFAGLWADCNNDGILDLWVANHDTQPGAFYLGQGNGQFAKFYSISNWIANGVAVRGHVHAWGDYDRDGFVDLAVGYSPDWGGYGSASLPDALLRNLGGGAFAVVTNSPFAQKGTDDNSIAWVDYDDDGDLDLVVVGGVSIVGQGANSVFRNLGGGLLEPVASLPFVQDPGYPLNQAWGDYDNDGHLDLYLPMKSMDPYVPGGSRLYHNNGDGTFTQISAPPVTGFYPYHASWADYDNDGYLDLFCTGWRERSRLFRNQGDGTFSEVLRGSPVNDVAWFFSSACWEDFDRNGFLDLLVVENSRVNRLYLHNGNTNHWLEVKPIGRASNRAAIGAKVRVQASIGGKTFTQLRVIQAQSSVQELSAHFGLGGATQAALVRIEWPSGGVQELRNVAAGQTLTVVESLPPTVALISPAAGSAYRVGETISLEAQASDVNGVVVKVVFYDGATVIGEATSPPYRFEWREATAGAHAVRAEALDNEGEVGTSGVVTAPVYAGAEFIPVAGLRLWLDAGQGVEAGAGGLVRSWRDRGAFGIVVQQEELGQQPQLVLSALNGQPVVSFDGVDDQLGATVEGKALFATNAATLYVVQRQRSGSPRSLTLNWEAPDYQNRVNLHLPYEGQLYFDFGDALGGGRLFTPEPPWWADAYHVIEACRAGDTGWLSAGGQELARGQFTSTLRTDLPGLLLLGRLRSSALQGEMAEVLVYSRPLEASERNAVRAYLGAKYNLPVSQNLAPSVALVAPADGSKLQLGSLVSLRAAVVDPEGVVVRVKFYAGPDGDHLSLIGEDTQSPFEVEWRPGQTGPLVLRAVGVDNRGAEAQSPLVNVGVLPSNLPPTVTLIRPADGSVCRLGAPILLEAQASDVDGTVAKVVFYDGAVEIGVVTTPPYRLEWRAVTPGVHALRAEAVDDKGAVGVSKRVNVDVLPPNHLPAVSLISPANGSAYRVGEAILLEAEASDPEGMVVKVVFYDGAAVIGEVTTLPYRLEWRGAAAGVHAVRAEAVDNDGGIGASSVVMAPVYAGAEFIPVAGLRLWLDAGQGVEAGAGGLVRSWRDRGAFGIVVQQEELGQQPQLVLSALNGQPVVSFDGVDDQLGATVEGKALFATNAATLYVVQRQRSGSPPSTTFNWQAPDYRNRVNLHLAYQGRLYFDFGDPLAGERFSVPQPPWWTDTYHVVEACRNGDTGWLWADGQELARGQFTSTLRTDLPGRLSLGRLATVALQGEVAELLVYSRALDENERNAVRVYLGAKYNLQVIPDHPPAVRIISPAPGSSFRAGSEVQLQAEATDADGLVVVVRFYGGLKDGVSRLLGEDSTPPYEGTWQIPAAGIYVLSAIAVDDHGAQGTSAPVTLTITEPRPPRLTGVLLPEARFRLQLTGDVGARYIVEASGDLQHWQDMAALKITEASGVAEYTEPIAATRRFYRARSAGP